MRTPLIAGNWKMNGLKRDAEALATGVAERVAGMAGVEIVVCPPFPHLSRVAAILEQTGIAVGAQNCADAGQGARTGEVAADMLVDLGLTHVILGHSERRAYYHEADALIAERYRQALLAGLTPILCVGETLEQRDAGRAEAVLAGQLRGITDRLGPDGLGNGVIAYEPVWAIGTGRTATTEQAQAMHGFLRAELAEIEGAAAADSRRIVYGGSMKPANAGDLLTMADVDGGLIGGAALDADDFAAICAAVPRG